jgi:hypothetical protein
VLLFFSYKKNEDSAILLQFFFGLTLASSFVKLTNVNKKKSWREYFVSVSKHHQSLTLLRI